MDRNGLYLQLYARAPAPCRDYYGLTISNKEIILNVWNITYGPHVYPKRHRCDLDEFSIHTSLKREVLQLFGNHVLEFCIHLSNNDRRLQCIPTKIFLCILRYLATNDILRLGQTSKIFFELCNRESVWKLIFGKRTKNKPCTETMLKANEEGWRNILIKKIMPVGIVPIKIQYKKDNNQKMQKKFKTPVTIDTKIKVINEHARQFKSLMDLNKNVSANQSLLSVKSTNNLKEIIPKQDSKAKATSRSHCTLPTQQTPINKKEQTNKTNPFLVPDDIMKIIAKHNVNMKSNINLSTPSLNNSKNKTTDKVEIKQLNKSKTPAVNMVKNILSKSSATGNNKNNTHGIKSKK